MVTVETLCNTTFHFSPFTGRPYGRLFVYDGHVGQGHHGQTEGRAAVMYGETEAERCEKQGDNLMKSERFTITGKRLAVAKMLASPAKGQTDKAIYEAVGISHDTFYRWIREDVELMEYVEHLIDKYTDKELGAVWKALIKECKRGDVRAIKLFFELKGRYRQQIEHCGITDVNITVEAATEEDAIEE